MDSIESPLTQCFKLKHLFLVFILECFSLKHSQFQMISRAIFNQYSKSGFLSLIAVCKKISGQIHLPKCVAKKYRYWLSS